MIALLPKYFRIKSWKKYKLQDKGEFFAMTGDELNDAPALAQADIGIAVGSGSDIAAETSRIILVNSNLKDIANLILFGKATNTTPMLLKTVSSGKIEPKKLITHHFKLDEIVQAYRVFGNAAKEKAMKVILTNE